MHKITASLKSHKPFPLVLSIDISSFLKEKLYHLSVIFCYCQDQRSASILKRKLAFKAMFHPCGTTCVQEELGVYTLLWALMLAPCSSSCVPKGTDGIRAARCRAVFPLMSTRLGSALCSSRMVAHVSC